MDTVTNTPKQTGVYIHLLPRDLQREALSLVKDEIVSKRAAKQREEDLKAQAQHQDLTDKRERLIKKLAQIGIELEEMPPLGTYIIDTDLVYISFDGHNLYYLPTCTKCGTKSSQQREELKSRLDLGKAIKSELDGNILCYNCAEEQQTVDTAAAPAVPIPTDEEVEVSLAEFSSKLEVVYETEKAYETQTAANILRGLLEKRLNIRANPTGATYQTNINGAQVTFRQGEAYDDLLMIVECRKAGCHRKTAVPIYAIRDAAKALTEGALCPFCTMMEETPFPASGTPTRRTIGDRFTDLVNEAVNVGSDNEF